MKPLIFATNNAHKLAEVQAIIGDKFALKSLEDVGFTTDIDETGNTFEENATIKSECIYKAYKMDCFADDSGLEIEALKGEPGVYSARYSGSRDSEKNLQLVLDKIEGQANRKANFRTVISLTLNGENHLFEGVIHGEITAQKIGKTGFGYDPIFIPAGYTTTFAEMPPEEKNKISHRSLALQKMVKFLDAINAS